MNMLLHPDDGAGTAPSTNPWEGTPAPETPAAEPPAPDSPPVEPAGGEPPPATPPAAPAAQSDWTPERVADLLRAAREPATSGPGRTADE